MKFLLVALNAKYIHSNLAVYSLRAFAGEKYNNNIEIAEYTINNEISSIMADIYARKPDVLAFSCYIWNWTMVSEIIEEMHKILPNTPIWLGGPEVSFGAKEILENYPCVSGIMRGEGEETFLALLQYYKGELQNELGEVEGITYRKDALICESGDRKVVALNAVPFIYKNSTTFHNRIVYYESARGCPYRCSYCLSSIDKKVRVRDFSKVKQELSFFLENRIPQVKFIDRTFNCNHDHALQIWEFIHENDNGITNFHFEIAADILTQEELTILSIMRPGLVQLEIGVQSANEKTLAAIQRTTNMDVLKTMVNRIVLAENIHVHLDLIVGLPFEDYESFARSFDCVYKMKPNQLQLGFLKVLKGSPMEEATKEFGIFYRNNPPYEVLYTRWISFEEVCRLKQIEEMVEIYYNSNQFTHTLPVLEALLDSPFSLFEKLAQYYEKKGYFINNPSRVYRYEVLLGFAKELDGQREQLYEELLTYDIYLRENIKSRPIFAKEQTIYKEEQKTLYENREWVEKNLPKYEGYTGRQIGRMTHLEVFTYAVWEKTEKERQKKCKNPTAILFDYKEKHPVTAQARTLLHIFGKDMV